MPEHRYRVLLGAPIPEEREQGKGPWLSDMVAKLRLARQYEDYQLVSASNIEEALGVVTSWSPVNAANAVAKLRRGERSVVSEWVNLPQVYASVQEWVGGRWRDVKPGAPTPSAPTPAAARRNEQTRAKRAQGLIQEQDRKRRLVAEIDERRKTRTLAQALRDSGMSRSTYYIAKRELMI